MDKSLLEQIETEFPYIKPYEEEDLEWWNEGLDYIESGNLNEAEKKFKMLTLSQPDHSDGFEGLSKVYTKMNRIEEAKFFINIAYEKAQGSVRSGNTDSVLLKAILEQKERIELL